MADDGTIHEVVLCSNGTITCEENEVDIPSEYKFLTPFINMEGLDHRFKIVYSPRASETSCPETYFNVHRMCEKFTRSPYYL